MTFARHFLHRHRCIGARSIDRRSCCTPPCRLGGKGPHTTRIDFTCIVAHCVRALAILLAFFEYFVRRCRCSNHATASRMAAEQKERKNALLRLDGLATDYFVAERLLPCANGRRRHGRLRHCCCARMSAAAAHLRPLWTSYCSCREGLQWRCVRSMKRQPTVPYRGNASLNSAAARSKHILEHSSSQQRACTQANTRSALGVD